MKKVVRASESVYGGSFNRARSHMNKYDCCFISASRDENSGKQDIANNRRLASDIRAAGLTYLRATGGYIENKGTDEEVEVVESSFLVVNNRYTYSEFKKLCLHWCAKYNQESVMFTHPVKESKNGKRVAIDVTAEYVNSDGVVTDRFDHVNVGTVEQFFSNMYGKDFVMSSTKLECKTIDRDVSQMNSHRSSKIEFATLYPELSDYIGR